MRPRTIGLLAFAIVTLAAFAALAQTPPNPTTDPGTFVAWLIGLVSGRNWPAFVGGLIVCVVFLLREKMTFLQKLPFIGKAFLWFKTRYGGWTLTALLAMLPAVAQGLITGLGWKDIIRETLYALAIAVAGWQWLKDLAANKAAKLAAPAAPPSA